MDKFDHNFVQDMKSKLDIELIGVASIEASNSKELRNQAIYLFPDVKSVVVLGKEIYKELTSLLEPSKEAGEAERGELLEAHIEYLNGFLTRAVYQLANLLRKSGYRSIPLPAVSPTDQRFLKALFSYRHAAQFAGLGTIGRHSLLITPEFGPRVWLACLLTDALIEPSPLRKKDYCVNCIACIQECPASALQIPDLGETYSINKFACRAYRQAGLTCSVCMKVCDEVLT